MQNKKLSIRSSGNTVHTSMHSTNETNMLTAPQQSSRRQSTEKRRKLIKSYKLAVMVFWVCILSLPALARSERPDLNNDFTDAERKEMCELLDDWMTAFLIDMHGDDFGRMHTTNDFYRWHRDHFFVDRGFYDS